MKYEIISEDKKGGIFKYKVNDIFIRISYPFYEKDFSTDSMDLTYLDIEISDKLRLMSINNVPGTTEFLLYPMQINYELHEIPYISKMLLDLYEIKKILLNDILNRNFSFVFHKEK